MTNNSLYITFDGLTDPLGQSQILPYIQGIAAQGYQVTVISCEKRQRLKTSEVKVRQQLSENSISWQYIVYNEAGGLFSRFSYFRSLRDLAEKERKKNKLCLVHCRSYIASLIGLRFKRRYQIPFIFDMRGFWADERIDGGIWKKTNPLHFLLWKFFKSKEKQFLRESDAVISLTTAGLRELLKKNPEMKLESRTAVIPCCTDTSLFNKKTTNTNPGLFSADDHVVVYTGSIGTWYYTKEMIDCMLVWKEKIPKLRLLILTKDSVALDKVLQEYDTTERKMIVSATADHHEIPDFLQQAKASVFFIKPAYSKIASSPTKMAECWAMDLPIITNPGIGDNDQFFNHLKGGVLVKAFDRSSYQQACEEYLKLSAVPGHYRQIALEHFDRTLGVKRYLRIYDRLCNLPVQQQGIINF